MSHLRLWIHALKERDASRFLRPEWLSGSKGRLAALCSWASDLGWSLSGSLLSFPRLAVDPIDLSKTWPEIKPRIWRVIRAKNSRI